MTNTTETRTTQIFRVYIKATPEAIWEAITSPEWNGSSSPSTVGSPASRSLTT